MHSKRPHALKPRPGGNNFVTVRCAVIEDEKWNNQKDLHHLVTFATRAKCLTEGLNKYMCGPTCPLHPTQSEIQNYQIRLQNPGAAKSLCNIFVSVPISLSFFFFRSLFFFWYVCMVHCHPEQESILWEHHKDLQVAVFRQICQIHPVTRIASTAETNLINNVGLQKKRKHAGYVTNKKISNSTASKTEFVREAGAESNRAAIFVFEIANLQDPRTTTIRTKHQQNEAMEQFHRAKVSRTSEEGVFSLSNHSFLLG